MALSGLPRFLASRTLGRAAEVKAPLWLITHEISTSGPDLVTDAGSTSFRRYAKYTVFKGKAALSLEPVLPTIREVDSRSSRVFKRGCVVLKFYPAIALQKYDWKRRQVFALSPTEAGNLIALGPDESCEFLHDPSLKSSLEGQVRKSLQVSPSANDKGYFLNLMVANKIQNTNERLSISVTKAEFAVIRTILTARRSQLPGTASNLHKQFERRLDPASKWEN
ncbi:single-stranded DNA-binding protein WHY2, mitochondrial-like isoform X2 [Zingiber officinale]|uniref:single-stranded DNA-binding protein WHY2, mitochondrial-like isoform X2 n=1 Tax=Zingiber officinale TaxID=94328 RepID=UPI001C4AB8B0|nr:single-stranded DNA-binding protein WHY2, mitochondrial-like isoform X2 [Zingiber officinale]